MPGCASRYLEVFFATYTHHGAIPVRTWPGSVCRTRVTRDDFLWNWSRFDSSLTEQASFTNKTSAEERFFARRSTTGIENHQRLEFFASARRSREEALRSILNNGPIWGKHLYLGKTDDRLPAIDGHTLPPPIHAVVKWTMGR